MKNHHGLMVLLISLIGLGGIGASAPQGKFHSDSQYVTITSKNYTTFSNFSWKKKQSTRQLVDDTFLVKGYYNNRNGSRYYSLYRTNGRWYGYVNARAAKRAPGVQGLWHKTNQYATLAKKGYPFWQSFFGQQSSTSSVHYQQTYHATGYYKAANGDTYLSLYTANGQWLGYVNQAATSKSKLPQGPWLKANEYVTVTSKNYSLLKNFTGSHGDSGQLFQKTFHVTGQYKPADGETYLSLYDFQNHWVGYLNAHAVKAAKGAQGAWLSTNEIMRVAVKGYPIWPKFFSGNTRSTTSLINQAVTVNGMYHHLNGSVYYSVYQSGHWLGYVNAKALSTSGSQVATNFSFSAHRGDHLQAPENSLEAITAAKAAGFGLVEMDVRQTKDGKLVLMHDATIDRTTTGSGAVAELTLAQIESVFLDVSGYPALKGQTLHVPTYDQAIDRVAADGLFVNLNGSKGNWANQTFTNLIVKKLKSAGIYGQSFFVLSDATVRKTFMSRYPDARVTWLYSPTIGISKTLAELRSYQHALLTLSDTQATASLIATANAAHVPVQVYDVNNAARASELKREGVTYIETDTLTPSQVE